MKKSISFFLILIFLCGCSNKDVKIVEKSDSQNNIVEDNLSKESEQAEQIIENNKNENQSKNNNTVKSTTNSNNGSKKQNTNQPESSNSSEAKVDNQTQNSDNKVPNDFETKNVTSTEQEKNDNSKENVEKEIIKINANKEYYCLDDYTLNGDKCTYYFLTNALYDYVCEEGIQNGSKCNVTVNTEFTTFSSSAKEKCNSLYGQGVYDRCLCNASGGTYNSNKCFKNVVVTRDAKRSYYCPDGLSLSGSKCEKTYTSNALYKYTCPDSSYTLIGSICQKEE